jgi:(1->4)-alpha-D-glucan 1-alpha-D-glucosylmutase
VFHPHTPTSTYRLQFNAGFTFRDARAIVDYLHALGIGDCYASSYLTATPGSPHGYDIADPTQLNPEIGSDDEYAEWNAALRERGMGHILDLVPNHMGIAKSANPWWQDVLENGPSSRYARVFDIEWHPVKDELADKVLLPILGDQYGAVLERQELVLASERGSFAIRYHDITLPIAPDTFVMILRPALGGWLADHEGADDAEELLSILTASEHLPSRGSRDTESIAVRAREKEVVKRRLCALMGASDAVRRYVDDCVTAFNGSAGEPASFDRLDQLLNAQSYRLAHWRVASEEINYRRFFDVNELAAVRMEDPAVFDEVHRFALDLVAHGGPTGLRIDHVDGLFVPGDYLWRLQSTIAERLSASAPHDAHASAPIDPAASPFYIVVEKILGAGEQVPPDWPIAGTTGYEFAAVVNNLFVDRRNERAIDEIYRRFVRERLSYADLAYRAKKQVLHETMSGDINSLAHQLNRFSERNRHFRDFTLYSLISTLKDLIACFPVYRTYVTATDPISNHDRKYIEDAVRCAKRHAPSLAAMVFDFVQRVLLKDTPIKNREECEERARFIGKFQQITSPVAAKGIEDTVLYVYNRLLSLNEVGSDPTVFGLEPAAVHQWMAERQRQWPHALSATSTHDSKRGEDVRARLNVLSEIPGAWKAAVTKWRTINRRFKTDVRGALAPDPNEEYFLYQTLVGVWPSDEVDPARLESRVTSYMMKAMREGKVHTSWLSPDEEHERAVERFLDAILDRRRAPLFWQSFEPFQARVAELGIYNSLAQLVIKIAAPGIPDFYQGTELWDLTLVDPDNRRPVDYERRQQILTALQSSTCDDAGCPAANLLEQRRDGRVKLFVTTRALSERARRRDIFERGDYVPLATAGARRDCVFAFARRLDGDVVIACVPRLVASLALENGQPPIGRAVWADTRIELPEGLLERGADDNGRVRIGRDAFTGASVELEPSGSGFTITVATLFERFPVALVTI